MSAIAIPTVRPSVPASVVTPEDLLTMEEQGLFELVDGKPIEKQLGLISNRIAGKIARSL